MFEQRYDAIRILSQAFFFSSFSGIAAVQGYNLGHLSLAVAATTADDDDVPGAFQTSVDGCRSTSLTTEVGIRSLCRLIWCLCVMCWILYFDDRCLWAWCKWIARDLFGMYFSNLIKKVIFYDGGRCSSDAFGDRARHGGGYDLLLSSIASKPTSWKLWNNSNSYVVLPWDFLTYSYRFAGKRDELKHHLRFTLAVRWFLQNKQNTWINELNTNKTWKKCILICITCKYSLYLIRKL